MVLHATQVSPYVFSAGKGIAVEQGEVGFLFGTGTRSVPRGGSSLFAVGQAEMLARLAEGWEGPV